MGGENIDSLNVSNSTVVVCQILAMLLVVAFDLLALWYFNMFVRTTAFDDEGYQVHTSHISARKWLTT